MRAVERPVPGPGEVVAMYRARRITPDSERFSLDDAPEAYRRLEARQLSGRAVVMPHG
jgi:propanol-preferring alcohol dehydrogenase